MDKYADVPARANQLAEVVIGLAIQLHRDVGPGLLERLYHAVLLKRIRDSGLIAASEVPLPLLIDGMVFDVAYRADIIVEKQLLIEIKSVKEISFADIARTKTYLRLGGFPLGLVLNFHEPLLKFGITRVVP